MENFFSNGNKRISWVQLCFLGCIVMLALCAILSLGHNGNIIISSLGTVGTFLFITGVICLTVSAVKKSTVKGSQWLMADGIVTTVVGVLFIADAPLPSDTLPFLFALWEIILGLFKIFESFQLKRESLRDHGGFLYIGIAEIVFSICFLIRFITHSSGNNIAVVITLALQMSAYALRYYLYPEMTEE